MAGKISSPANINKNPNIIIAAQKEMASVDVLVCGICHAVFHIIEEFMDHKSKKQCNQSTRIPAKVESTATVWAYLLWKSNYLEEMKAKGTPCKLTSWDIYQIWHNSPIESRNSWIKAGRAMQASQVIGRGILQEVPKKDGGSSNLIGNKTDDSSVHVIINSQGKAGEQQGKTVPKKRDFKDAGVSGVTDGSSKTGAGKKSLTDTKSASVRKSPVVKVGERARKTIVNKDSDKGKSSPSLAVSRKRKLSENDDDDDSFSDKGTMVEKRQLMIPVRNAGRPKGVEMASPEGEEYAVEKILAKRFNHRWKRHEYWIKWEGYSMNQNTWEPAKNLATCQDLLEEFERKELEREKAESMALNAEGIQVDIKVEPSDEIDLDFSDSDVPEKVQPAVTRSEKFKTITPSSSAKSTPSSSARKEPTPGPDSSDNDTTPIKPTRGRKLGSKNKVKEKEIDTPLSSSGRPSRNSKQKALSQVKLWCGLKKKVEAEEVTPGRRKRAGSRTDEDENSDAVTSLKRSKVESQDSDDEKTPKQVNSSKKTVKDELKLISQSKMSTPSAEKSGQDSARKGKDLKGEGKKVEMPLIKLVKNVSTPKNVKTPKPTPPKVEEKNDSAAKAEEERRRREKELMLGSAEKAIALMRELTADRPDWDDLLDGKDDEGSKKGDEEDDDVIHEKTIELSRTVTRLEPKVRTSVPKAKPVASMPSASKEDLFAPVVTKVESRVAMESDPPPQPTSPVRDVKERTFTLLLGSDSPSSESKGGSDDPKSPKQLDSSPNGGKKKDIFILPKIKEVLKDVKPPVKGEGGKNLVVGKQRGSLARLMMTISDPPVEAPRKKPPNILSASHSTKVVAKPLTHFIVKSPQTRLLPVLVNAEPTAMPSKPATTTPVTKTFITRNPIQVTGKDPGIKLNPVKMVSTPKGKLQVVGPISTDGSQVSVLRTAQGVKARPKTVAAKAKPVVVKKLDPIPLPPPNSTEPKTPSKKGSSTTPASRKKRRPSGAGSSSSSESEADPFDNLPPIEDMNTAKRDSPPPPITLCPLTGMLLDDGGKPMSSPLVEKHGEEKVESDGKDSLECSVSDLLVLKSSEKSGNVNEPSLPSETSSVETDGSSVFMRIVSECTGEGELSREGNTIKIDANQLNNEENAITIDTNQLSREENTITIDTCQLNSEENAITINTNQLNTEGNAITIDTSQLNTEGNAITIDTSQLNAEGNAITIDTSQLNNEGNAITINTSQLSGEESTTITIDTAASVEGSSSADNIVSTIEIPVSGLDIPAASIRVPVTSIDMPSIDVSESSMDMPVATIQMPVSSEEESSSAKIDSLLKETSLEDEPSMKVEVSRSVEGKQETKTEEVLQLGVAEGEVSLNPEVESVLPVDCEVGNDGGEIVSTDAESASESTATDLFMKEGESVVSEATIVGSVEGANEQNTISVKTV
ncbi:titin isoform X2 [Ischnura elegans]|uniref:titin isoform X2 n=1 Tax=Ischnura elegans TaxID=197161 RepID=UPI001ED8B8F4|nr:titin isoform X2 [Ischnura elegans]